MIEYDETMEWTEEMGVALLEEYHEPKDDYPVWDDYAVFAIDWSHLKTKVLLAMVDDAATQDLEYFRCDSCHHEDLMISVIYEEDEALMDSEAWQILVPMGESPRMTPDAIVNCPDCVVAR